MNTKPYMAILNLSPSSSSFLQNNSSFSSSYSSPPLLLSSFKVSSSLQTHEKASKPTNDHQQPNYSFVIPTLRTLISHPTIPPKRSNPQNDSNQFIGARPKQNKRSLLSNVFAFLDEFVVDFLDPPLHSSIDPKFVLSGNFSPVEELPPTPCTEIEGSLPPELTGTYIRNGPNPQFYPVGPYHLFDGDGMLHAITISGPDEVTLCSRFVRTYKFDLEKENGSPVILNVFSAFNGLLPSLARCLIAFGRVLAGEYDPRRGIGGANTSLALFGGKLYALGESDLPYAVKLTPGGDVVTLGRQEEFGEAFMTMTAHPKVDADTGEAFAYRHSIRAPYLTYFKISADGVKQPEVPITSPNEASLVHDFAVTKNYAVFPDSQIAIKPSEVLRGRSPVRIDPTKVPKLGVIPRDSTDDTKMWWIEVPEFNMVHAVNAWEEDGGNTVVLVATNVLSVEHVLERMDLVHSSMERIEIDLKRKQVIDRRPVSASNLDFGVINPAYVGKMNRYVYAGIGDPMPKFAGVVKIDLSISDKSGNECTVARRMYGPGCYGGEPFFVARDGATATAEEDDGYLVSYVHDEKSGESKFVVMDAKSPSLEILASVKLPRRVPFGFHGIFLPLS